MSKLDVNKLVDFLADYREVISNHFEPMIPVGCELVIGRDGFEYTLHKTGGSYIFKSKGGQVTMDSNSVGVNVSEVLKLLDELIKNKKHICKLDFSIKGLEK